MDIQRLKEIPIREVARKLGLAVPERGNIRCFSHEDKDPSLSFFGNSFKCHGCGISGDNIKLVELYQNQDFKEACDWLASVYGIGTTRRDMPTIKREYAPIEPISRPTTTEDQTLYELFYQMTDPLDASGQDFLRSKGFTEETINHFGWKTITKKAIDQIRLAYSIEEIEKSGLSGLFGSIGWCLIPYWNDSEIVYLRARKPYPKDIRSITGKDTHFYNFDALVGLVEAQKLYISEGETDTMTLYQQGLIAVGVPGALQQRLYKDLTRLISKNQAVVLCFDNDEAGSKATELVRKILLSTDIIPSRLMIPENYKDINDFINNKEREV